MAILQWLLGRIASSASTLLNALFGWAVLALFGQTSPREKTWLSGLVASAAAWPLLVLGAIFPRMAAKVLAFLPLPPSAPTWIIRLVWICLVAAVPLTIGVVFAMRAPPGTPKESPAKRVLRGVPITLGLAGAFLMMVIIAPVIRLISSVRRLTDEHLTLLPHRDRYAEVTEALAQGLREHAIPLERIPPPWWLTAPSRLLSTLGGSALRGYATQDLACYRSPQMQLVFYPSDLLIRGEARAVALAHSLLAEQLAELPAYQTLDPHSQMVEEELKAVWATLAANPEAHVGSRVLAQRVEDVAQKLVALRLPFAEWEVIYRLLLQLGRALDGKPPLLSSRVHQHPATSGVPAPSHALSKPKPSEKSDQKEAVVNHEISSPAEIEALSTASLVKQIAAESKQLVTREIELAKAEIKEDLKREGGAVKGLGVAALFALGTFNALLTTGILALAQVWSGWVAGLVVAGASALIAGLAGAWGWKHRVRAPLSRTRHTLEEDLQWAKNRMA